MSIFGDFDVPYIPFFLHFSDKGFRNQTLIEDCGRDEGALETLTQGNFQNGKSALAYKTGKLNFLHKEKENTENSLDVFI